MDTTSQPSFGARAIRSAVCLLLLGLAAPTLQAATNQVGSGKAYATVQAAVSASANGDIVEVYSGTYSGAVAVAVINNSITIRGIGARPVLNATGYTIPNGKAIFVAGNNNVNHASITIENLEFMGAAVPDANGSGIRPECTNLTVRSCYFHDNQDGIQGGWTGSSILVEYCEFANNGAGDGQSHNMYINSGVSSFTLRYCYTHNANQGHLIKTRADTNYILYNRITEENGYGSYELDIPQGGLSFVVGNLIEKGANAVNHVRVVCYADENTNNPIQNLYFANNTLVNDYGGSPNFIYFGNASSSGRIVNNIFVGNGTLSNGVGTAVFTNNLALAYGQRTQLVNSAGYDYHLIPFAAAIDKGVSPGVYSNFDLTPISEYVHPTTCGVRQVEAALDQGAYECSDANGDGIEDNWQRFYFGSLTNALAAPNAHPSGNGFTTRQDYLAGLDPTNADSRLTIQAVTATNGGIAINWLGGTSVWQYVETRQDLTPAAEAWQVLYTNAPTLLTSNRVLLGGFTNQTRFFRISAGQP